MNTDTIAIHESKNSDKVIRFLDETKFTESFLTTYNIGLINGCFYLEDGSIAADDIYGDTMLNILK